MLFYFDEPDLKTKSRISVSNGLLTSYTHAFLVVEPIYRFGFLLQVVLEGSFGIPIRKVIIVVNALRGYIKLAKEGC